MNFAANPIHNLFLKLFNDFTSKKIIDEMHLNQLKGKINTKELMM